jgi:hypothetical protein
MCSSVKRGWRRHQSRTSSLFVDSQYVFGGEEGRAEEEDAVVTVTNTKE